MQMLMKAIALFSFSITVDAAAVEPDLYGFDGFQHRFEIAQQIGYSPWLGFQRALDDFLQLADMCRIHRDNLHPRFGLLRNTRRDAAVFAGRLRAQQIFPRDARHVEAFAVLENPRSSFAELADAADRVAVMLRPLSEVEHLCSHLPMRLIYLLGSPLRAKVSTALLVAAAAVLFRSL